VNLISQHIFKKLKLKSNKNLVLNSTKVRLEGYGGSKMDNCGTVDLMIKTKDGNFVEKFIVTKLNSVPILGLSSSIKLNLIAKNVDHVKRTLPMPLTKELIEREYRDVFTGIGCFPRNYAIEIKDNAVPSSKHPYRIPLSLRHKVKAELDRLCQMDIIEKYDKPTEWASRLVIVQKPNGSLRLCLDPKEINQCIKDEHFNIPTLDDLKSKLKNASLFSVLDLKDGFWQIKLEKQSIKYCVFSTIFGCYAFKRLPFGLKISPQIFQKYNTELFGDIEGVFIYIDDLLIYAENQEKHDEILQKAEFMWIDNIHTQCLNKIKSIICNAPVLQNFDNEKEIIIQTDSSKDGIGCVLMQNKKPVCFASKSLSETEMRYAQIDKEFLAILFACKRFHHYIYGRKVVVQTDHKPLVALMQKEINKINSNRLQRISMKLSVYDLEVKYVPGSKMYIADAISRACSKADNTQIDCDLNDVVHVVNVSDNLKTKLQVETGKDSALQNVIKFCENGWPKSITKLAQNVKIYYNKRNSIVYEDGLLFIDKAIIVPNTMQEVILRKVHSSHLGISKTKQRAKSLFYWPGINSDIEGLISNCKVCQRYRNRNAREPMLYHTIPELPFEIIGCDILEYANKNYLVLVDYFSKWVELKLLKSKDSVEIAHVLKEIFAIHGIPVKLIADNVPFGSFYLKQFAESWNFQLVTSSPYYPKSNGLSERYVGICKKFIKKSVDANVDLQEILLEYRNTPVMGSAYSPAQLLFSRKTRTLLPISNHSLKPKLVADFSKFLMKKKCEMKSYYDRNSKIRNYKVKPNQPVTYRYGNEWHPGSVIGTAPTP
ncbi:hypothetical protein PPYR_15451, partial [Photinus pyralis]